MSRLGSLNEEGSACVGELVNEPGLGDSMLEVAQGDLKLGGSV